MSVRVYRETVFEPETMIEYNNGELEAYNWRFSIWSITHDEDLVVPHAIRTIIYKSLHIYKSYEDAKKACNEWLLEQSKRRTEQSTSKN